MMNTLETIFRSAFAMLLMMCGFAVVVQSQSASPPTQEQEFLDSIRKGNATRVRELLKQNPTLSKATTKNGTTAVLVAVYSLHPEIAELLLATSVEPNIFEAAATGRPDVCAHFSTRIPSWQRVLTRWLDCSTPELWQLGDSKATSVIGT